MSTVGQVKNQNYQWQFQDVINACRLYEEKREQRGITDNVNFLRYPKCVHKCPLVSAGRIYICTIHGNVHICTRESCEFIQDKKDEHKQVCVLTGIEYIRDFDMNYIYEEADENSIDPDSVYCMDYVNYDKNDESAVLEFRSRLDRKRRKRQKRIDSFSSPHVVMSTTASLNSSNLYSTDKKSSTSSSSSLKTTEKDEDSTGATEETYAYKRRKKKNKQLSDMSLYERKFEIDSDRCFIEQSIQKLNVKSIHSGSVFKNIMDTWMMVNRKDMSKIKNSSSFYNLFMHISVVFKYIQDGMNGIVDKIDNLYSAESSKSHLNATEICEKLGVNSKHYTTCCTIFRQIVKSSIKEREKKGL